MNPLRRSRRLLRTARRHPGPLLVAVMWLVGLSSIAAVLSVQGRLDQRRRAQLAVASLRIQMNELPRVALDLNGRFTRAEVRAQLRDREASIVETANSLDRLSGETSDSQLVRADAGAVFPVLDRVNVLASSGRLGAATETLGGTLLPGAPGFQVNALFDEIGARYARQAAHARGLAESGSVVSIVLVLIAFSLVLRRAVGLAREKHALLEQSRREALTDQLTGLWNRRRLFSDLEEVLARPRSDESVVVGMFDLDGFKAYNDEFGHPAGDELLHRLGDRLVRSLDGAGSAYRMGGDEFCAIAHGADPEGALERAREALTEQAGNVTVSCSLGMIRIVPSLTTPEEVFRRADRLLYDDKRSSRLEDAASKAAGPQPPGEARVFAAA